MKKVPALTVGNFSVMRKFVDSSLQRTGLQIEETLETSSGAAGLVPSRSSVQEGRCRSRHRA